MSNIPLMPQAGNQDLEEGSNPEPVDGPRNQRRSTSSWSMLNQPTPTRPLRASDDDDSSRLLYSIYSKIAKEEDNTMVEYCQKISDGTLIFSGLFSATVGGLLTLTIPDLKPNSQDTSAFYLQNIYQLQASGSPNASNPLIPSALAVPPAFSPPNYAIWVNSLWCLSLAISLSGAMVATVYRNWAVQYMSVAQPLHYSSKNQVRIRAIFATESPGEPHVVLGATDHPIFIHLSLLLFVIGVIIYLFNINVTVFYAVGAWVGIMAIFYATATTVPFILPRSLFHTPLSPLAMHIYVGISFVVYQVCSCIPLQSVRANTRRHYRHLSKHYSEGFMYGKWSEANEIASKPSSEIDGLILERILLSLDEDPALETFFDAIPGFCKSKLTKLPLSFRVQRKIREVLDDFLDRTFSSSLVSESVRTGRLITYLNAAHAALGPSTVSGILDNIFNGRWNTALESVEIGDALRLWDHRKDHDLTVQKIIACIIARARQRDDRWTTLVKEEFGVPDDVLRDRLAHGDNVLLSILIYISRQANRANSLTSGILSSLSKLDVRTTLPELQHDFCTLWNEIAQGASNRSFSKTSAKILCEIRHIYVALHPGTDATPTPPFASTDSFDSILFEPSSYPLCNIASHRPDSTTHVHVTISDPVPPPSQLIYSLDTSPYESTIDGGTNLRPAEETRVLTGLPQLHRSSTANEIEETSQAPMPTFPVLSSLPSADMSARYNMAVAQPDTTSAAKTAKLSHPLENNKQQGLTTPYVVPQTQIYRIRSIVPAPAPVSASTRTTTPVLNYEASPALISKFLHPASNGGFSAPISLESPPLPQVPPLRFYPRKLVDNGNVHLANAVLHSLVYCPPFRELFIYLGQREGRDTVGDATPLIDATVRFLGKFAYKEKSSLTHQAARGKRKEDGGVSSFLSTDVYDALKEKEQFIFMSGGRQQDAAAYLSLYLEALDEELVKLRSSISTHKPKSSLKVEKLEEGTRSGEVQTKVGERDYTANSVASPISLIFGGKSRSTVREPNRPDTVTIKDWRLLQLNIQPDSVHTVEDALAYISRPQPVHFGQLNSSKMGQHMQIEALPSVLVLHLERFLYDAAADGIVKINKPVQFPPELEIPLETMAPIARKSMESTRYKLYGVLYHRGESASGGHYTVDVLHQNGESGNGEAWLHIDGGAVSTVRYEDVFVGHDGERVEDECADMLVYCRTGPTQT